MSPVGAVVGGALGGLAGSQPSSVPLPLEQALRLAAAERGFQLVSFVRTGSHWGRMTVWHATHYHAFDGAAPPGLLDRTAIDDAIYDHLVAQLDEINQMNHGGRP